MKQKRNYTLTEQEENKIVNQIYNKKILLIKIKKSKKIIQ